MEKKLLIANWKMNSRLIEGMQLIKQLRVYALNRQMSAQIIVCPPYTLLRDMADKMPGTGIKLGGQNCWYETEGAYTGEVSALMLKEMTCDYVILGHSERRQYNHETSDVVKKKATSAIAARLQPIICIGETMYERDNDLTKVIIREQLVNSVPDNATAENIIIAYEPVWAIGSGKTPTIDDIEVVHNYIRDVIAKDMPQIKPKVKIVYGGSTNGENSKKILQVKGVDGLLVGKSSLNFDEFLKMIESAN